MDSERFDVRAKVPPDTTPDQVNLMLQKLIADRFRMTIHRETKELPIYALVLGKNGHKLKTPNPDDKEPPIDAVMAGRGAPPPPPPPPGGGEGGGRAMMVMAVSYTHLDVYKRQASEHHRHLSHLAGFDDVQMPCGRVGNRGKGHTLLCGQIDVYKRQG